jgi:hypothetical protein
MSQWFRVFGRSDVPPAPDAVMEKLHRLGVEAKGHFRGDDLGWFAGEIRLDPDSPPLQIERFLTKEDELRGELNTWAAWVESAGDGPEHLRLMQHLVSTVQFFTLRQPIEEADEERPDAEVEKLCEALAQFLARVTEGVYQIDHRGFFAADGTLLVAE